MCKKFVVMLFVLFVFQVTVCMADGFHFVDYNVEDNLLYGLSSSQVILSTGFINSKEADSGFSKANILFDGHIDVPGYNGTSWVVENGKQKGATMIVHLGKYMEFDKLYIVNGYSDKMPSSTRQRLVDFSLYYWDDYKWIPLYWNNKVDTNQEFLELQFDKVTTSKIRLVSNQEQAFRIREIALMDSNHKMILGRRIVHEQPKQHKVITVNNKQYRPETKEVLFNSEYNTVFVSSKTIKEFLPVTQTHDYSKGSVTFTLDDYCVQFTVGQKYYIRNGQQINMDVAPYYEGSKIMIPIRDLVRSVGFKMSWNEKTSTIKIYDPVNLLATGRGKSPYKVKINDEAQEVFVACSADFVQYQCPDDKVKVDVEYNGIIKKVDIRPISKKIQYTVHENVITFYASRGDQLSVEINEDLDRPLFVFLSEPIERPDENDPNVVFFDKEDVYEIDNISFHDGMTIYLGHNVVLFSAMWTIDKHDVKLIGTGIVFSRTSNPFAGYSSSKIYIQGPVFPQPAGWHLPLYGCSDVVIKDFKEIASETGSDGIDFIGTSNVLVDGYFTKNQDDGLCIKTRKGYEKAENFVMRNLVIWTMKGGNGIELGFEMNGWGRVGDILCENVDVIHRETKDAKNWRAALSIHHSGNALVENVTYKDVRVEESDENFLCVGYFYNPTYYYDGDSPPTGVIIRNITFQNVEYNGKNSVPSYFYNIIRKHTGGVSYGLGTYYNIDNPDYKITLENIVFDNVTYQGRQIKSLEDAKMCNFMFDPEVEKEVEFR